MLGLKLNHVSKRGPWFLNYVPTHEVIYSKLAFLNVQWCPDPEHNTDGDINSFVAMYAPFVPFYMYILHHHFKLVGKRLIEATSTTRNQ